MENNRRNKERATVSLEIALESASGKHDTRISDLSVSGCFVDSIASHSTGEIVALDIRMPSGEWLRLSGEVAYVYPGIGFGVKFTLTSDEDKAQLEEVVWRTLDDKNFS
jgi:hypothetical protein